MINIDWLYLRKTLIILVLSIAVSSTLILGVNQVELVLEEDYQHKLSNLRTTHSRYSNLIKDIDLLDQYRMLFNDYRASGLVGGERRLSWIESLESTNEVLGLPTLSYHLLPQEAFKRPGFKVKRNLTVNSSPMELNMGLMHEEDFFALLEGLQHSVSNLLTVDSCSMSRMGGVSSSLDTQRANIRASCLIRWVTIDGK